MEIKPLPSVPVLDTQTDKSTRNAFSEAHTRINQLIKKVQSVAGTILPHKTTHATGGSDALTPADIGAAPSSHVGAALGAGVHPIPSGCVVQVVNDQTGAVATGTAIIPVDDTTPQKTEGTEWLTLTITPKGSGNFIYVDVILSASPAIANFITVALFKDSDSNAVASIPDYVNGGTWLTQLQIKYKMTAGSTSPITFKVRYGPRDSDTVTINGRLGSRLYGGTLLSSITITEVQA